MNQLVVTVIVVSSLLIPVLAIKELCDNTATRQARIDKIGETILVKLQLPEPPENPPEPVKVSADMAAEFVAVQAAVSILESSRECPLQFEIAKSADLINATSASEAPSKLDDFCILDYPCHDDSVVRRQPGRGENGEDGCHVIDAPTLSYRFVFPLDLTDRVLTSLDLVTTKMPAPALGHNGEPTTNIGNGNWVEINLIYPIPCYYGSRCDEGREVITGKFITSQVEGFEVFNVTSVVERWMERLQLNEPVGEMELEIKIRPPVSSYCSGRPLLPSISFNSTETYLLVLFQTDNQIAQQRRKRQTADSPLTPQFCFENPDITNCCVKELIVNFEEDLGWTWIVMPAVFSPNYCLGLCPYNWPVATNVTSFFQLYHEQNPTSDVEPCCATKTLSSLNIVAIMNGEMIHTIIPDVIVNSCVCK